MTSVGRRFRDAAVQPVDGASVAVFRIAFGVAIAVNAALYFPVLAREYYIEPSFSFGYGPLDFLEPPPGQGIRLVYLAMILSGILVALGWRTRLAAAGIFLTNTYIFLLDSTYFQNHEYLISLLALLLIVLPTDRRWSLDAHRRRRARATSPDAPVPAASVPTTTVPAATVWMLRFQIGVPYFYGGLAKLNADWFNGEPLRLWLARRTDIEPIHSILTNESVVTVMNWGALAFDLTIVPLLLHRRTRVPAFVLVVCFHLTNAWLFGLFIFPWLMIAATTIFFPPDWPLRVADRLGLDLGDEADREPESAATTTPVAQRAPSPARTWTVAIVAALWVAAQLLVPLRHLIIPGDPNWTEQGHRFAWHMRLRDKASQVTFVVDDGERVWRVDPSDHLGRQQASRLGGHPERLVQFSRHLSEMHGGAAVRAETWVSLNGRDPQPIVDPDVDLSQVEYSSHGPNAWILPLEMPRKRSTD